MIEPVPDKKGSASAWQKFTGGSGDTGGDNGDTIVIE